MLSRKNLAIASLCTIVCAQGSFAEEAFKSSEFLTYSADHQRGYISTSAMMAGLIAAQNDRKQAMCVDDWVALHRSEGYSPVIDAMKKYPDDHPTGLVLAVLQKACGSFKYGR